jgi:hypothetical protein
MIATVTAPAGGILAALARIERTGPAGLAAARALRLRTSDAGPGLPQRQGERLVDAATQALTALRHSVHPAELAGLLHEVVVDVYVLADLIGTDLEETAA